MSEASKTAAPRATVATKAGARIEERKLDNGMTVLVAERHLDPVVAVMLWYRVGARNELEREAGVSHFLEHMMFKGSRSFAKGEIDRITTQLGGNNNAFTSADHTAYWFELASDRWEKALEIEADRMRGLLLDPAEYEAEKKVVLEELSMGLDDPWRSLTELVQGALFPRHPYRRPVIGYPDTLAGLGVADMRDYYARFYHPGNATLVVCGDVDREEAFALADRHFGSIPGGISYAQADAWRPAPEEPKGEQRVSMSWPDNGKRLCMGWPTAPVGTDDDYALDLVSTLLSGGRMSRLHRSVVLEKGLATSISTQNDARVEQGAFWIFAECAQGTSPAELEKAIDAEVARMRDDLVPAPKLDRAKKMLAAGEAYDSETVSDLAEEIGEFAVDADWHLALHTIERIRSTDAKALRDCARKFLVPERRVVGWSLPRTSKAAASSARTKPGKTHTAARSRAAGPLRSASPKRPAKPVRPERAMKSTTSAKRKKRA